MSAVRQLQKTSPQARDVRPGTGPRRLGDDAAAQPSPARALQDSLEQELATHGDAVVPRWPGLARVGLIGGGSLLLWGVIIMGVRAVL